MFTANQLLVFFFYLCLIRKITHSVQDLLKLKIDVMTGLNIVVDVCASEVNVDIEQLGGAMQLLYGMATIACI